MLAGWALKDPDLVWSFVNYFYEDRSSYDFGGNLSKHFKLFECGEL